MKNVTLKLVILFNLLTITAMAQTKGRFEVHDLGNFKLHVYYTNDALGDASYIIEGKDALVTMEQPLFKDTWQSLTLIFQTEKNGRDTHHGLSCGRNRQS